MPPSSNAWVPSVAGLIMGGHVVMELLKDIDIKRVKEKKNSLLQERLFFYLNPPFTRKILSGYFFCFISFSYTCFMATSNFPVCFGL